jgi:PRD domain protein (TIGR03582 family)
MYELNRLIDDLSANTTVNDVESEELYELLSLVMAYAEKHSIHVAHDRGLAIASHLLAFVRRVQNNEFLDDMDTSVFRGVDRNLIAASRQLLESYCDTRNYPVSETEALLLSIHFAVCSPIEEEEDECRNK